MYVMKKVCTILCCAIALVLGGCSDKDDNAVDLSQLTGTWELVKSYDGEYDEWDEEYGESHGYISTSEFRADGTGTTTDIEIAGGHRYTTRTEFTYSLQGKTIVMVNDDDEDNEPYTTRIEKLTADELIAANDYNGEDGKNYTDKAYFKRIA